MPRSLHPEHLLCAAFVLVTPACVGSTGYDAGPEFPGGVTVLDIGTPCFCELNESGTACKTAPTNTCGKTALTCVIHNTPNGNFNNAGNALWEAPLFRRFTSTRDGGPLVEGECSLVWDPTDFNRGCPGGSVLVQVSSGQLICKRTCQSDGECGRPDWVCDQALLDRDAIDTQQGVPQEIPLGIKICRPPCQADFTDCNRSTPCTLDGRGFCQRSGLTPAAPQELGIYIGGRNGARTCNLTTGKCQDRQFVTNNNSLGGPCNTHDDCPQDMMCISDFLYADPQFIDGVGFCGVAGCVPGAAAGQPGSCVQGLTCQWAFEMGMCFPDCAGGTICAGQGQKCAIPDPARMWSYLPQGGQVATFSKPQCVDCDTTGVCP